MNRKSVILIVDDMASNIQVLATALSGDYEVLFATGGTDALAIAARELPDLVLLDVVMPQLDGYEVCRRLKADPATADIPVVFVTALAEESNEEQGLDAGAIDYIFKPISSAILRARVRNHITRRRAEEALVAKTAELERSNADLQSFAYAASHDLQAPLRAVTSFLQLLKRGHADSLNDEGREFIEMALGGAVRMNKLIQALLVFSRVGSGGITLERVDPAQAITAALANLVVPIEESAASIHVGTLPIVTANGDQLVTLFQNLIGNALKYHRPGVPPVIEIGVSGRAGRPVFFVRDHGIGIDSRHFDRVFAIFARLHTETEFAGSGVGLALCKRIVERHHGRIWVESEPGNGSTFHFTLASRA
jgi:light-regulated signal transduction histidine kinase (bacteriophytochrome)